MTERRRSVHVGRYVPRETRPGAPVQRSAAVGDVEITAKQQALTASKIWELYQRRVRNGQDLTVIVSDHQSRRGTGKTVLSLKLAAVMDRTEEGLTAEKTAITPQELIEAYLREKRGSALVLDEAEVGVGARDAMTAVNKTFSQLVAMGRIEEKYLVINAPSTTGIDKSLREMADLWALVEAIGRARIYRFRVNPFQGSIWQDSIAELHWSDIGAESSLYDVYQHLTEEKHQHMTGTDDEFVRASEVQDQVETAVTETQREVRNQLIQQLADDDRFTYSDIADALPAEYGTDDNDIWDISAQRVGQIARGDA